MLTRTARRGIPAAVLVAAGLALTACGPGEAPSPSSSSSASGDSSTSSDTGAGSAGGSSATGGGSADAKADGTGSSGAASSNTTGKSAAAGSVPACATNELQATAENFSAGAGHTTFQIVFKNTASAPCTLTGYPGVSFTKEDDTQLGKAATRAPGPVKSVTLIPNAHVYADARTVNGPGGYTDDECDLTTVPTLRVYPPNQKKWLDISWNKQECVGSGIQNLQVGPVHSNK